MTKIKRKTSKATKLHGPHHQTRICFYVIYWCFKIIRNEKPNRNSSPRTQSTFTCWKEKSFHNETELGIFLSHRRFLSKTQFLALTEATPCCGALQARMQQALQSLSWAESVKNWSIVQVRDASLWINCTWNQVIFLVNISMFWIDLYR